ncbi:MAG: Nif11-like leader peptide family natural product precursor [Chlorobiaceae bacterium]|jgi:predicted ribosomally synthesized peptide with nif11-like leader
MSIEHTKAFIQDLLENSDMKEELWKCSTIEKRLSIAESIGYGVTIDDVREMAAAFNADVQLRTTLDASCRVVIAERSTNNCQSFVEAPGR